MGFRVSFNGGRRVGYVGVAIQDSGCIGVWRLQRTSGEYFFFPWFTAS